MQESVKDQSFHLILSTTVEVEGIIPSNDLLVSKTRYGGIKYIQYFKMYLQLGFYLGIFPFQLKQKEHNGKYYLHTNKFQRILSGIFYFNIFYHVLFFLVLHPWNLEAKFLAVQTAPQISVVIYMIVLTVVIWRRFDDLKNMFDLIQDFNFSQVNRFSSIKINIMVLVLLAQKLFTAIHELYVFDMTGANTHSFDKSFEDFYSEKVFIAKQIYLFMSPTQASTVTHESWEIALFSIHMIILSHCFMFHVFEHIGLLTICALWHVTRDFLLFCKSTKDERAKMKINDEIEPKQILVYYEQLKCTMGHANSAVGPILLYFVGVCLPLYVFFTTIFVSDPSFRENMLLASLSYYTIYFLMLALGADIDKKGKEFYSWVASENISQRISSKKCTTLDMDLQTHRLSLNACGVFGMTYRLLLGIIGALFSYTLILIQLQAFGSSDDAISKFQTNCTNICKIYCNDIE